MTGGAGGIVAGLAQGFAAAGARLVQVDRNEAVEERAAQLRAAGADVATQVFDITNEAAVAVAIGRTRRDFGRLDVVVNNAAVIVRKHMLELAMEEWRRVLDVNVTACFSVAPAPFELEPGHHARCIRLDAVAQAASSGADA